MINEDKDKKHHHPWPTISPFNNSSYPMISRKRTIARSSAFAASARTMATQSHATYVTSGSILFATTHSTPIAYPTSYSTGVQSVDLRHSSMRKPPTSASAKQGPTVTAYETTTSDRPAKRRPLQTQKRREQAWSILGSDMPH
jgi:hypothetical protein